MSIRTISCIALVPLAFSASALAASASDCGSLIKVRQHNKHAMTLVEGRNKSGQPILAYVVLRTPTLADDYKTIAFKGVFTGGDALRPRTSMNLGSFDQLKSPGSLIVDYVRLGDGSTCGLATSPEAHTVAARFLAQ